MEEHREPDPDHDPESEHQRDGQVAIPRRVAALGRSSTERRPARANASSSSGLPPSQPNGNDCSHGRAKAAFHHIKSAVVKFGKFVGPGFMIAVAYSKSPLCPAVHPRLALCPLTSPTAKSRPWQLFYRHCRRSYVPVPSPLHRAAGKRLCHLPAEPSHQTGHRERAQSCGGMPRLPAQVVELRPLCVGRDSHYRYRYGRGKGLPDQPRSSTGKW